MSTTLSSLRQVWAQLKQAVTHGAYALSMYAVHTLEDMMDECKIEQILHGTSLEHDCLPVSVATRGAKLVIIHLSMQFTAVHLTATHSTPPDCTSQQSTSLLYAVVGQKS